MASGACVLCIYVCVFSWGSWEVKANRSVSIFKDHMEILLCLRSSRQITGDPNGFVCVRWMVCVWSGRALWPQAYGQPIWRRAPSNVLAPLGLWFVNELLYWLKSWLASLEKDQHCHFLPHPVLVLKCVCVCVCVCVWERELRAIHCAGGLKLHICRLL